tara:strand:+ start:794 stop:1432 length:639 start_codon:yes stop_codon:yes gene_type:complete
MKIKNIIWDWNGTLINDAYLFVNIMNTTLIKQGLPEISLADYKNNFCFPIQKYWKKLGFKFTKTQFDTMNASFLALYRSKMKEPDLQPHALDVLSFAKKQSIKQFVLSASEHNLLLESVRFYKIEHFFVDVVGVDNLNAEGKELLAKNLMNKHGLIGSETVVVGDTLYDERVAAAISAGLFLVACGHFNKDRLNVKRAEICNSLIDIIPLLV